MESLVFIEGKIKDNLIVTSLTPKEITSLLIEKKVIVIKNVFPEDIIYNLRKLAAEWAENTPLVTVDDFKGNYHSQKVKLSNIQKTPHVFHDCNFNDFSSLSEDLRAALLSVFEPLRVFYNSITGYNVPFGYIKDDHYFHPQLIQYPVGGGFFGRHIHNLQPQQVGFILNLSKYKKDYTSGGTCFEINGEVIDIEDSHDIGDLCLFPYDLDHWVKQSSLQDQFSWDYEKGRWVATLAYFNPY
jgi:hypothetical protein